MPVAAVSPRRRRDGVPLAPRVRRPGRLGVKAQGSVGRRIRVQTGGVSCAAECATPADHQPPAALLLLSNGAACGGAEP